jgi:general secretion pathway protein B
MSFILDALKKSELERQRQTIPGLMDAGPLARRPRFPIWAVALVVLLGVNLAVLLFVLLRGSPSLTRATPASAPALPVASAPAPSAARATGTRASLPAPASLPAAAAPHEPPVAATLRASGSAPAAPPERAPGHFSPMDAAPVYAPEIPAGGDGAALTAASKGARAAAGAASSAGSAHARDPVLTASPDTSDEEVLPTISEIDLSSQPPLPDLHIDVHVFAAKPADRFVYIDMQKYREGAALLDGLTLERIRRDGVVLNYHGLRFVLPRQQ